jgi:hypothetical protein
MYNMVLIVGTVTLTPIASVDTSSSDSGVTMFSLFLDPFITGSGNLFQFEYYISIGNSLSSVTNGNNFIAVDAVGTQGISNQFNIAIPSLSNVYDPVDNLVVKVRAYVATGIDVSVSEWSNTVPVFNPPEQPLNTVAYVAFNYGVFNGPSDELLYVAINDDSSYDLTAVKFIISYSYTDYLDSNQWMVSEPLSGTYAPGATNGSRLIAFEPIQFFGKDSSDVYVAVNAVFSYPFNGLNYYTVSQISTTVKAKNAAPEPPVLAQIAIPGDYLIYPVPPVPPALAVPGTQQVVLNWTAPTVQFVPDYGVVSYTVVVSTVINTVYTVIDTIIRPPTSLTYTYTIQQSYYAVGTASVLLSFEVTALNQLGQEQPSNLETVNTFTYATKPQNLMVAWANTGSLGAGYVDMLCTFSNPVNNGQGSAPPLVPTLTLQVFETGNTVATYTLPIQYVAGTTPYSITISNLQTSSTGTVVVYMSTVDTNSTNVENGETNTVDYVSSDAPIIYDVVRDTTLSFKVLSAGRPLGSTNKLVGDTTSIPFMVGMSFSSIAGSYSDGAGGSYTVTGSADQLGDYNYAFVFNAQWLINAELLLPLTIVVANGGMTSQVVPVPA